MKNQDKTKEELIIELQELQQAYKLLKLSSEKELREREITDEALRESEERFKALHNASFGGIGIHDKGVILECNQGLSDMTGYLTQELIGMNGLLLIAPESRDLVMHNIVSAYEKPYEAIGLRKNGQTFPMRLEGRNVPYKGKIVRTVEFRDITDTKKAEEALRKSEAIKNKMLSNIGDVVVIIDKNEVIKYKSPNIERLLRWSDNELIGKDTWDNIHPEDIELGKKFIQNLALEPNSIGTVEIRYKRKDNTYVWIEISIINLLNDPDIQGFLGNYHEITSRKSAEQELLKAKEIADANSANLTAIIEGTADNIWAFDRNFKILYINQAFQREFFNTFGVLLEPGVSLIEALPEPFKPIWIPRYKRVLQNEQYTIEDAINTENGTIYIQVTFNPIVSNGEVIGGSCFGSNITARKQSENDLIKAKELAEESDKLKTAFLCNMSHEIRTPMNGILGFADLLKEPSLSGDKQQEYISIIEKSGVRMLNIINDIIDISKIEAGLIKLEVKESNINEQIEYINTFFKPETDTKGLTLSFKNPLSAKEATIKTDREKLYALLTNLVKNAIKYTNHGSIEFGYFPTPKEKPYQPNSLTFYVKDTGIGIPKNRQQAIFERFVQADIGDTMALQGAGLGLTITKSYLEMLGGTIWVESEVGVGSTFYFTLPYNTQSQLDIIFENDVDVKDVTLSKLKVLIAEDDEISRSLITINLNKISSEILLAKNGIEAIEICRSNPSIDLVLMDIRMPEMGGYEATRAIRQFNKEVVIIAQTAFGLSGDREKAIDAGCNDYISEPINKDELLSIIHNYFKS